MVSRHVSMAILLVLGPRGMLNLKSQLSRESWVEPKKHDEAKNVECVSG